MFSRHDIFIATDGTFLGAHFQDFDVATGVIPGNARHNTVLIKRCQLDLL